MNVFKWLFTLPPDPIDLFELNKQVLKQDYERKLRDEFAAKAMRAYLAYDDLIWTDETIECAAERSYKVADAMLAEREKIND